MILEAAGKESACNAGDLGAIPGLGRFPGEGKGYPLQCSGTSLVAQLVKNRLQCRRPGFDPWVRKIPWRGKVYPFQYFGLENSMDCISPWGRKEDLATFTFTFLVAEWKVNWEVDPVRR